MLMILAFKGVNLTRDSFLCHEREHLSSNRGPVDPRRRWRQGCHPHLHLTWRQTQHENQNTDHSEQYIAIPPHFQNTFEVPTVTANLPSANQWFPSIPQFCEMTVMYQSRVLEDLPGPTRRSTKESDKFFGKITKKRVATRSLWGTWILWVLYLGVLELLLVLRLPKTLRYLLPWRLQFCTLWRAAFAL